MRFKWMPALLVTGSVLLAQEKPQLTARELFYVPSSARAPEVSANKPAPPKPVATTPVTPAPKPAQVAVVKPAQKPVTPVAVQEVRNDNEVRLVSAAYTGPRPLGLRYSLLKQTGGNFRPVNVDTVFRSGDAIRVKVESNESGYLYIVARGSSGNWDVLFPSKQVREGNNYIDAGESTELPSKRHQFRFDENKGEEKIFLVLSRKPVSDLDKLIYDLNSASKTETKPPEQMEARAKTKKTAAPAIPPAQTEKPQPAPATSEPPKRTMLAQNIRPIDDQLVGRLRGEMVSRDLVFETVSNTKNNDEDADDKDQAAAYVVEKSGRPDARLVVDIKLKHQ